MAIQSRTWIELSASALRHNLRRWQQLLGPTPIMPIVKANAYGHGWPAMVSLLNREKIWGLGVAYGEEALALRQQFRRKIVVLSFWRPAELRSLIRQGIEVAVWDETSLRQVEQFSRREKRVRIHLKLDTGTSRVGFLPRQVPHLPARLKKFSRLTVAGVFSHLANAEESSQQRTREQVNRFTTLEKILPFGGAARHLACTAAIERFPQAHFDLVRLGIGLYGLWPSAAVRGWYGRHKPNFDLQPVLSWKSQLEQVKILPTGTGIGYGSTVVTKRPTRIGVVPVGYADGFDRRASNTAWMMLNGHPAPVLGRVAMNLTIIDLSRHPQARVGQAVTLVGPGAGIDQLAESMDMLNYELVSRIHSGIERRVL